jgi:RNA polymerase sigma factor (sigma-70 family)
VRPTYEGDPRLYFLAVANNLIKENFRRIKTHVSLSDVDLSQHLTTEGEKDDGLIAECLETCLEDLSPERRMMIIEYYAKEKMAKIEHRSQLAQRLGISVETLRVRVFRIRASLEECIERCVTRKAR